jgi:hypothetical protein
MDTINREDAGWIVALAWLSGLEETARDFHGTRPRVFSERAYEHVVQCYLRLLGDLYGMQISKSDSLRSAVENYIQIGITGGLFRNANHFELLDVNPSHLEITVHDCVYLKSCQTLLEEGFAIRDLTCARIGCFRAAVKALADIDCVYRVTSFNIDGDCKGYIERV